MTKHIVKAFEGELEDLSALLSQLGGLAETQLAVAVDVIRTGDAVMARKTAAGDEELDRLAFEIDVQAVQLLARRQPMARDLREVIAAMKIASNLERVGDLGRNIMWRVGGREEGLPRNFTGGVQRMGRQALAQLKDALDAYAQRSAEKAYAVWHADQELDETFNSVFRELLTYMLEDPRSIGSCTDLLFIAKHIERAGDHSANIAETIIFLVSGQPPREARPKGSVA